MATSGEGDLTGVGARNEPPSPPVGDGWRALADAFGRDLTAATAELDRAWDELLDLALDDVSDARLTELEARLGVPGLLQLREEHDDRIVAAQARRAELVEMDEVARPSDVAARIEAELAAARTRFTELEHELARWEASSAHRVLVARGFFEPERTRGWWARRGDRRLLRRLALELGLPTDGELPEVARAARRELRARLDGARALEARLLSRRRNQAGLERERASLTSAPSRLHTELRRRCREVVRRHLEDGAVELRYELARDGAEVAAGLRRIAGLQARVDYLRQLAVSRVTPAARAGDADRAGCLALDRLRERLVAFDAWHRGGIGGHVLWWDLMTGGAPADGLPEVEAFLATWGGPVAHEHPTAPLEAELESSR